MKRLLAPAVLAVAFSASLPAQNTGTVGTPASFKDEAKAGLAVELIKKYEGLHDRSDYPYYGYGHCKLPGEELSYDMTEAEAEKLLISTSMTVTEIALATGFGTSSYFIKIFRRYKHLSPRQFRAMLSENA